MLQPYDPEIAILQQPQLLVNLRIFFQPHQRLFGITVDLSKIKCLLDLHKAVLEYLRNNVTHVAHNPNDYILVKNNYLPLEDIGFLTANWQEPNTFGVGTLVVPEDGDNHQLIMITRQQFMTMVTHIKGESERMRQTPLQRFADSLKESLAREERAKKGFDETFSGGCGYWNNGDGNIPDEDGNGLYMKIEALPPKEKIKEDKVAPEKNVFGAKGELLQSQITIDDNEDDADDIMIVGDNVSGFSIADMNKDPREERKKESVRVVPLEERVEDKIERNKQRHLKIVRQKANMAAVTGELLPFKMQQVCNNYKATHSADRPDYEQFEQLREAGSSGVLSHQPASTLMVQNEMVKESDSAMIKHDDDGDLSFKPRQEFSTSTRAPSFLDRSIINEIPGDSALNSVVRNYDLNYRPYETRDYDYVRVPKEENLMSIDTVDFFEFERVFNCTRQELIHLSKYTDLSYFKIVKGQAAERQFGVTVQGDNIAKCYRLVNFKCVDSRFKKKERDLYMDRCTFYLQYLEEPDQPNLFRLHSYNRFHNHFCKRREVWNMADYYQRKTALVHHEPRAFDRNCKKDWRNEFMKSLTYELTTVYADQIVSNLKNTEKKEEGALQKGRKKNKRFVKRLMGERGGDKLAEQMEKSRKEKENVELCTNTRQLVRHLNIDKELYFERHINIFGMEQKI